MSVTAPAFDKVQAPSVREAVAAFCVCEGEVRDPAGDSLLIALDLQFLTLSPSRGLCRS